MSNDDKNQEDKEVLHQADREREDEPDDLFADNEEDDLELEQALAARRRWIKNAVISVLVVALIINILAFWPRIYNMETLPFLFKSRELSSREEIQSYKEAVVLVSTDQGKGTGFHVSDGYIVTNYHVIEDKAYSIVTFPGNNDAYRAIVAASAPELDIAILKVDLNGRELPHIEIEREAKWKAGSHIYVIGNPLYFTQIANEGKVLGLVSVHGRQQPVLAVDAPVFKGNSGSPVINEQGKAIAVIYAIGEILHEGESIQAGLAVPLDDLADMLRSLPLSEET